MSEYVDEKPHDVSDSARQKQQGYSVAQEKLDKALLPFLIIIALLGLAFC